VTSKTKPPRGAQKQSFLRKISVKKEDEILSAEISENEIVSFRGKNFRISVVQKCFIKQESLISDKK
jgi:hypothetical protein